MIERKKKLLVLTSTFPRFAGDTCPMFVADLAQGLSSRFDVTVLAPASAGARLRERMGDVDVRRYRYGWPARTQKLADGAILPNIRQQPWLAAQAAPFVAAQLIAARRLLRDERFDAIHAHWAVPQGVVGAALGRRYGVPVLTTTHGGDVYGLRARPFAAIKRWALRGADRVTAVSDDLKREVVALGVDASRVSVIPMGVDTSRFSPAMRSQVLRECWRGDSPLLLFVGRLAEKKGARYAIEAMPQILESQPSARLLLVGDGPERASLKALARDLGVGERVTFLGAIPNADLPAHYASADMFVGPSVVARGGDTESFGVVFAEAMASGCATIATDVGGVSDLVVQGETGLVIAERDARAIADAVRLLCAEPALGERLVRNGTERMRERFDHRVVHAAYGDLIEDMIEGGSRRADGFAHRAAA
jgi:glycosyltransferase involved in cell wall biosynthesis